MIRSPAWPRRFSQSYPRPSPRQPGHHYDDYDDKCDNDYDDHDYDSDDEDY